LFHYHDSGYAWRLKSGLQVEVVACEAFRYVEHRPNGFRVT
jgi:hypothetical protein